MLFGNLRTTLFKVFGSLSMAGLVLAAVTAATVTAATPQPAFADNITPPPVPANLEVPAGHKVFMVGHATGTQNYVCAPSGTGVKFVLFTPQATLFGDNGKQLTTHYFSPNPSEPNTDPKVQSTHTIRATWQSSKDTSTVWGMVQPGHSSTDPAFVEAGAIGWLLVTVVGKQDGANGGDQLSQTTYIQRLNTHGGVAPATGCASAAEVGNQAFVPYTTDYYFYKSTDGNK